MEYRVIRSSRKTLGMQVGPDGITVRAPYFVTSAQIDRFVRDHAAWAEKRMEQLRRQSLSVFGAKVMTADQLKRLTYIAKQVIPPRVEHFARLAGAYQRLGRVTIRCQKTRWGSCTARGDINMNCLLALAPKEVLDYVAAHEVCHLFEMNHSAAFYRLLGRIYPDYGKWNRWLKDNGAALQAMVPGRR